MLSRPRLYITTQIIMRIIIIIIILYYYSVIGWKHGKLYQKNILSKLKISNPKVSNKYTWNWLVNIVFFNTFTLEVWCILITRGRRWKFPNTF
jgi:magnesium-transporting ATPase (P-type)